MPRSVDAVDAAIFPGGVPSRTVAEERKRKKAEPEYVPPSWDSSPIVKTFKGHDREFFTIGALAAALGRKPVTIRLWEDQGRLPMSRFRTPAPQRSSIPGKSAEGRRLYTREQVEAVIAAAEKTGVTDPKNNNVDWVQFRDLVVASWKTLN
jgi:hypothetical protein